MAVHTVGWPAASGWQKGATRCQNRLGASRGLSSTHASRSTSGKDAHLSTTTYKALAGWETDQIDELVKVLTVIGISLERDAALDERESLASGKPTTPLGKYQFVVH